MKETFTKLRNFLNAPYHVESYSTINKKEFIFLLLITFAIVIPYALILEAAGMDQFDHKLEDSLQKS